MIGIIGAMEDEVAQLKKNMEIEETTEVASLSFVEETFRQRGCCCKEWHRQGQCGDLYTDPCRSISCGCDYQHGDCRLAGCGN